MSREFVKGPLPMEGLGGAGPNFTRPDAFPKFRSLQTFGSDRISFIIAIMTAVYTLVHISYSNILS